MQVFVSENLMKNLELRNNKTEKFEKDDENQDLCILFQYVQETIFSFTSILSRFCLAWQNQKGLIFYIDEMGFSWWNATFCFDIRNKPCKPYHHLRVLLSKWYFYILWLSNGFKEENFKIARKAFLSSEKIFKGYE